MKQDHFFCSYFLQINECFFVAAAAHHRSEGVDAEDHYRIAYDQTTNAESTSSRVKEIEESVLSDQETTVGFVINQTKRGKQTVDRLGKLILSHIFMDLVTGRVMFDLDVYTSLIDALSVEMKAVVLEDNVSHLMRDGRIDEG